MAITNLDTWFEADGTPKAHLTDPYWRGDSVVGAELNAMWDALIQNTRELGIYQFTKAGQREVASSTPGQSTIVDPPASIPMGGNYIWSIDSTHEWAYRSLGAIS